VLRREDVLDLDNAATYHLQTLAIEGATAATQRQYEFYWDLLIDGMLALHVPLEVASLDTNNVRAVLAWYRDRVNPASSRHGAVSVRTLAARAKTFARFLEREGILPDDTLRTLKVPRVGKILREPYTQIEVNAMWGVARSSRTAARDEALFLLLLDTGMRIGEAATLTIDRLRLDQRQALVGRDGKGRRERLVPMGDGAKRDGGCTVRALRAYLTIRPAHGQDAGRLFLSHEGRPLSSEGASRIIQRLGEASGVQNPIAHRLRHTFCTWYLVAFPGDEIGLRRIVGHLSHEVTADYVHFAQSIIADRAGRASLAEQWLGNGVHAHPIPFKGTGNVRAFHCTQCARRAAHSH
jgi:site-specific recombinase XerD